MDAGPFFRRCQELSAYALLSMVFSNVPTFDESHGVRRIAAVRMGTQPSFEEAKELLITSLGDQSHGGARRRSLAFQNRYEFPGMFFSGTVSPQCVPHASKLVAIRRASGPD
jgi:hypothetical protein